VLCRLNNYHDVVVAGRGEEVEEEGIIPPPIAAPIVSQIPRPFAQSSSTIYGFRDIVGHVLGLVVDRWGVCPTYPPLADTS